jgi:hypothetical protein
MLKCGPELLCSTGLVRLLENAIFPGLLSFSPRTPQDEYVSVLEPTYDTLILLSNLAHEGSTDLKFRDRLLERMLREGIFATYNHIGDQIGVVGPLMRNCASIIKALGIRSSKHMTVWITNY